MIPSEQRHFLSSPIGGRRVGCLVVYRCILGLASRHPQGGVFFSLSLSVFFLDETAWKTPQHLSTSCPACHTRRRLLLLLRLLLLPLSLPLKLSHTPSVSQTCEHKTKPSDIFSYSFFFFFFWTNKNGDSQSEVTSSPSHPRFSSLYLSHPPPPHTQLKGHVVWRAAQAPVCLSLPDTSSLTTMTDLHMCMFRTSVLNGSALQKRIASAWGEKALFYRVLLQENC